MKPEQSPEFLKSLNEVCEKRWRGWKFGGGYIKAESLDTVGKTLEKIEAERKRLMEKHEEYVRQAELVKVQSGWMRNPHMREIMGNLKRKNRSEGLICPVCGEGDHGNRINGKPVCYMNSKHKAKGVDGLVPLMSPEEAEEWEPPKKKPTFKESWELDNSDIVKARK